MRTLLFTFCFLMGGSAFAASDCVKCHQEKNPGIVGQWKHSKHSKNGVGCIDCHQAKKGDADVFMHNGALISVIVSPNDCATCHEQESKQFQASHHADSGKILGSLDNTLAEVVEGHTVFNDKGEKIKSSPARFLVACNAMAQKSKSRV